MLNESNCPNCKVKWGAPYKNIVLVEYDYTCDARHDGWSEVVCQECKARFGRWSGKHLQGEELEYPYWRIK